MRFMFLALLSLSLLTFGCGGGGGSSTVNADKALANDAIKTNPWKTDSVSSKPDSTRTAVNKNLKKLADNTAADLNYKMNKNGKTDTFEINEIYDGSISGFVTVTGNIVITSADDDYPYKYKYNLVFNFDGYEDYGYDENGDNYDYGIHGKIYYTEDEEETYETDSGTFEIHGGFVYKDDSSVYSYSFQEHGNYKIDENGNENFTDVFNGVTTTGSFDSDSDIYKLNGVEVTYDEYFAY